MAHNPKFVFYVIILYYLRMSELPTSSRIPRRLATVGSVLALSASTVMVGDTASDIKQRQPGMARAAEVGHSALLGIQDTHNVGHTLWGGMRDRVEAKLHIPWLLAQKTYSGLEIQEAINQGPFIPVTRAVFQDKKGAKFVVPNESLPKGGMQLDPQDPHQATLTLLPKANNPVGAESAIFLAHRNGQGQWSAQYAGGMKLEAGPGGKRTWTMLPPSEQSFPDLPQIYRTQFGEFDMPLQGFTPSPGSPHAGA